LAEDEDLAALVVADEDETPWKPAGSDWSLMHELTAEVRDRLGEIAALIADLPVGVKTRHKAPPQFPRPETAMTRATRRYREQQETAELQKIEDWVEKGRENWRRLQAEQAEETADALDIERPEAGAAAGLGATAPPVP
jgi:hypothetical protein